MWAASRPFDMAAVTYSEQQRVGQLSGSLCPPATPCNVLNVAYSKVGPLAGEFGVG